MTITKFITEYSGSVPNRQNDIPVVFAQNVYNYQIWIDSYFVPDLNAITNEINSSITEMQAIESSVKNQAIDGGYSQAYIDALSAMDIGALPSDSNAVSATKLQTARTINGVAFNGTSDINIPSNETYGWVLKWSGSSTGVDVLPYGSGTFMALYTDGNSTIRTATVDFNSSINGAYYGTARPGANLNFSSSINFLGSTTASLSIVKTSTGTEYLNIQKVYKWEKL